MAFVAKHFLSQDESVLFIVHTAEHIVYFKRMFNDFFTSDEEGRIDYRVAAELSAGDIANGEVLLVDEADYLAIKKFIRL